MNKSILLILMTLATVALIDYIPRAFFHAKKSIKSSVGYGRAPRYLIMPTVYGDISYLQTVRFLKKYASKVVICTSLYETPEFYSALRKVCRANGFSYICVDLPTAKGKPIRNAYTIYRGAFRKLNRLRVRRDTPCLLIDADTYTDKNVNNLVRTFVAHRLDIASLRCEVANPTTLIETLQDFEYNMAMDNRRMDPWLTSGACNIARAQVFQKIFNTHSNFFAGGDIEIGKLAQVMGYRLRHIEFTFFTAAPKTFKAWFRQRIIWFSGGVRHHVANIGSFGWHHFFMLFYNSLIIYLLFPLRWVEIVNYPATLAGLILLSWVYTAILIKGYTWKASYLLLPAYSFIQSMIILPIAFVQYFKLCISHRSFGILKYDFVGVKYSTRMLYGFLNISSAVVILTAAGLFTMVRWEYWMQNGHVLHSFMR
jgi:cellulose synthase/poly-beta-1,6-N-acetylglucosamine synthase-like glycosyltransferase